MDEVQAPEHCTRCVEKKKGKEEPARSWKLLGQDSATGKRKGRRGIGISDVGGAAVTQEAVTGQGKRHPYRDLPGSTSTLSSLDTKQVSSTVDHVRTCTRHKSSGAPRSGPSCGRQLGLDANGHPSFPLDLACHRTSRHGLVVLILSPSRRFFLWESCPMLKPCLVPTGCLCLAWPTPRRRGGGGGPFGACRQTSQTPGITSHRSSNFKCGWSFLGASGKHVGQLQLPSTEIGTYSSTSYASFQLPCLLTALLATRKPTGLQHRSPS